MVSALDAREGKILVVVFRADLLKARWETGMSVG